MGTIDKRCESRRDIRHRRSGRSSHRRLS